MNGLDWETVILLQADATQGKIWLNPKGNDILLAYEIMQTDDGNHIAIKHYKDLLALIHNEQHDEIKLERSLAPFNEGTPNFETVHWTGDLQSSMITLSFHYYSKNKKVD